MTTRACRSTLLFCSLVCLLTIASPSVAQDADGLPTFGEDPGPFVGVGPDHKDKDPVRVRFAPELTGSTIPQNTVVEILTEGMPLEFEEATPLPGGYADGTKRPNAGHLHVYGTRLDEPEGPSVFHETNLFLGAAEFAGTPEGAEVAVATLDFPTGGEWMLVATAQYDDHTQRVMAHPQQWPSLDAAVVSVVAIPEPGAGLGLLVGVLASPLLGGRARDASDR